MKRTVERIGEPERNEPKNVGFPWVSAPHTQKPYPPLIVVGAFPYGAHRGVRYGDGWIPSAGGPGRADIATTLPQFRKLATEGGRDPASLPVTLFRVTEADAILPILDRWAVLMRAVTG